MSITEDLTNAEWLEMKSWSDKAKQKNSQEPTDSNITWRARGNSKNGYYLKKFNKQAPAIPVA